MLYCCMLLPLYGEINILNWQECTRGKCVVFALQHGSRSCRLHIHIVCLRAQLAKDVCMYRSSDNATESSGTEWKAPHSKHALLKPIFCRFGAVLYMRTATLIIAPLRPCVFTRICGCFIVKTDEIRRAAIN